MANEKLIENTNIISSAIFEEYKSLKAEIFERLKSGQNIINVTMTFTLSIIGFLGILQKTLFDGASRGLPFTFESIVTITYLIGAVVTVCFSLMDVGDDIMIGQLAFYINNQLRPKIERLISSNLNIEMPLWEWEEFKIKRQLTNKKVSNIVSSARYISSLLPSILFIFAYIIYRFKNYALTYEYKLILETYKGLSFAELLFLILYIVLMVGLVIQIEYLIRLYRSISVNEYDYNREKI